MNTISFGIAMFLIGIMIGMIFPSIPKPLNIIQPFIPVILLILAIIFLFKSR